MTEEQRNRLAELAAKQRASARDKEISRIKAQMADEIAFFSERYVFADAAQSERLRAFVDALPFSRPGWVDIESFERRSVYSPKEPDGRRVWICFLSGSEEIFDIFVGGTASDFLVDLDEWQFYSPFLVLAFDDLGGFIFTDDNENMTEVIEL